MILVAAVEGDTADECADIMQCQLKFYFNQCYNPFAHQYEELHSEVLPEWWKEIMVSSFADNHKMRYVSATLHRHYAYAFGPFSIFHHRRLMAVFWQPERIPMLVYPNTAQMSQQSRTAKDRIKKAQRCAFRCMQHHARTRWLAAVRVILRKCLQTDVIDKMILAPLHAWNLAQGDPKRGTCAADMPDRLCDDSMYLMEEAIERALQGRTGLDASPSAGPCVFWLFISNRT
jgi:hypothetical protein